MRAGWWRWLPGGDASKAAPRGTSLFSGQAVTVQKTKFNDAQETLFTLADDTGGKALLDSNDLTLGIQQAHDDLGSYYVLGYYDSNPVADGKYRRVQVNVSKQYAAQLDYRNGYFAGKEFNKSTSADKERQLQEALILGDPVTDLPLALEINYFRLVGEHYFVPVAVKISGSEIALSRRGAGDTTEFDFVAQVTDAKGQVKGNVRDTIKVKMGEGAAQLASRNIQYDTGFTLSPGKYRLKFLARENQGGKMGTFETDFVIPNRECRSEGTARQLGGVGRTAAARGGGDRRGHESETAAEPSAGVRRPEADSEHHARAFDEAEPVRVFRGLRSGAAGRHEEGPRDGGGDVLPSGAEGLRIGAGAAQRAIAAAAGHDAGAVPGAVELR